MKKNSHSRMEIQCVAIGCFQVKQAVIMAPVSICLFVSYLRWSPIIFVVL